VHCAQHAGNELVDTIALLNQGHQRRNPAFIVRAASEVRENELLEGIDLILQRHQVRNGLVALVRVIDRLKTDVLLVFEGSCSKSAVCRSTAAAYRTVELWMLSVEGKLGQEVVDVL
jgi:hypothetical protein